MRYGIRIGLAICVMGIPIGMRADSTAEIKALAGVLSAASAMFTAAMVADVIFCINKTGVSALKMRHPCVEMVVAGLMAAQSAQQAAATLKKAESQKGGKSVRGGGPETPPSPTTPQQPTEPCTEQERNTCENLAKLPVRIKKEGCICLPDLPITPEGEITNPELRDKVPPEVLEELKNSGGDPEAFSKALEKKGFGSFAGTDQDRLREAVEQRLDDFARQGISLDQAGALLGSEPESASEVSAEEKGPETVEFGGKSTGVTAGRPEVRLPAAEETGTPADRFKKLQEKKQQELKQEVKKFALQKGSGMIADEYRGIFAAVSRQYDTMEAEEFQSKHYILEKGIPVQVKFIPDPETAKGAIESLPKGEAPLDLGRQIQKFGK